MEALPSNPNARLLSEPSPPLLDTGASPDAPPLIRNPAPPDAIPPVIGIKMVSEIAAAPPLIAERTPSNSASEIVGNEKLLADVVRPPILISAQNSVWGDNPGIFWDQLGLDCENYSTCVTTASLIDFSNRLNTLASETVRPWKDPINLQEKTDLWIIGDLHGDLLAFRALTEFAKRTSAKTERAVAWCFLGDLFDDGQYGHAILHEVLSLVDYKTGFLVVGNHDLSLYWKPDDCRFGGDVSPHDFADWLNKLPSDSPWRNVAISAIRWFKNAPRALLLADGTLIAHGGCVHADRLSLLDEPDGLLQPGVLEDLVWLRAHETSKRKIPNRTARGCQFGFEDFRDFLKKLSAVLGRPVQRVIRGHDHMPERWASPVKFEGKLLTLNAMSCRRREATGPFVRQPIIARFCPNEFPELFRLDIPTELVERIYGEKGQTECGTSVE